MLLCNRLREPKTKKSQRLVQLDGRTIHERQTCIACHGGGCIRSIAGKRSRDNQDRRVIAAHRQFLGARTVFIVEHNMNLVMALSHKVVVMAHGQVIAEGSPGEVQSDPEVLSAYLGVSRPASAEAGNG
jgi:hypothetical protein